MDAPTETVSTDNSSNELSGETEVGGKIKVPLVAEGEGKLNLSGSRSWGAEASKTYQRKGLNQVIKEIAKSEFVVFIDDFHYIKADLRDEIGKQIKVAAESGVKIFTASVPHRADDVVRSNPELRGRVAAVDISYWSVNELIQIARKGFYELNTEIAPALERQFAGEAFGSPQLMQSICLNLCYSIGLKKKLEKQARTEMSAESIAETLLRTSSFSDFSKMLNALHTGPRTRGTERKIHSFTDKSRGDVYRATLLAIKADPAGLSLPYDAIINRVRSACIDEPPAGSSITSALEQMHIIGEEIQPGSSPLSWYGDNLDIVDPYFLFYLRCSEKLAQLAKS
jgi:hypothetical protein